jgi:HSP20 family molecular chaperone IbpA
MIKLPVPVEESETEASYENGLLTIVMPKTETEPENEIKIRTLE